MTDENNRMLGGRYRIQSKIGIGGMATVYRGSDTVLGRTVAIKTMLPQYAHDSSFAARFKQEAQAAAALQSPYIVGIFDWGQDGDTYYIVMEYLKGTDLKTGLRTHGALDSRKVAQIGSQICQALSVAHRHDIIHRDIKPQNIMVQPDGNIKVMDFGIARAKNSHITTDNSVLGTAHYVSPEQTQGKTLGPTSDIYSLGIVMYEAATGQVPFKGDDAISVALKQVKEMPRPPHEINPNVSPTLEAIILKCLEKNPANRFQSAESLRRALTDYLAGNKVVFSNAGETVMMGGGAARQASEKTTLMPRPSETETTATQLNPISSDSTGMLPRVPNRDKNEKQKDKKQGKAPIIIAVVAVIAAIILGIIFFAQNQFNEIRAIPNCANMTEQAARQSIQDTDFFVVGRVTKDYSDSVEEGKVMDQDPLAGAMKPRGTVVNLVISEGKEPPKKVNVPDLTGKTPSEAEAALKAAGLVGKSDTTTSDNVDTGTIAKQSPSAGSQATEGDTVTYYVSTGKSTITVPNVKGQTKDAAIAALKEAGFSASADNYVYSDTVPKDCVVSYSPTSSQSKGANISLTISLGPKQNEPVTPGGGGQSDDPSQPVTPSSWHTYHAVRQRHTAVLV